MSITVFSQNLTVISYGRRASDGKVLIRYTITEPGVYYNIRFASRAYPPGNEAGFPMTPALDDPDHMSDPLIVSNASVLTWVWDAPADGYGAINLAGWTLFLSYMNLYCCTIADTVTRVPTSTGSGGAPGTAVAAPSTPPSTPGGIPVKPVPAAPAAPAPVNNAPPAPFAPGGFFAPAAPGPAAPLGGYYPPAPGAMPVAFGANPILPIAAAPPAPNVPVPAPILPPAVAANPIGMAGGILPKPTPEPTTVSASIYTGIHGSIVADIANFIVPSSQIPRDAVPMLFTFATVHFSFIAGCSLYIEGMDSTGARFKFPDVESFPAIDSFAAYETVARATCLHLNQFAPGLAKIVVGFRTPAGAIAAAKVTEIEILEAGVVPAPTKQERTFPQTVLDITGFEPFIEPAFEGSYNAVGDEDYYLFTAAETTSIVVKISRQAQETNFVPVLKVFSVNDLNTPLFTAASRFEGISDEDTASHRVGWKDETGTLTEGGVYAIQVVHQHPFYSRGWGFKVYSNGTVADTWDDFSIDDDGKLAGELNTPYGRQSLKIVNGRTHDTLFVTTKLDGTVPNIQAYASPASDRLSVSIGDPIRVYRPGPGVLYRSSDLILETTA